MSGGTDDVFRSAPESRVAEADDLLLDIIDVCVGWTGPMTDSERLKLIQGWAEKALAALRAVEKL